MPNRLMLGFHCSKHGLYSISAPVKENKNITLRLMKPRSSPTLIRATVSLEYRQFSETFPRFCFTIIAFGFCKARALCSLLGSVNSKINHEILPKAPDSIINCTAN